MVDYATQIIDLVQRLITIASIGLTMLVTIARPLHKNLEQQVGLTKEIQATNTNLSRLIEENQKEHEVFKAEHAVFRQTLAEHDKRIYKMED